MHQTATVQFGAFFYQCQGLLVTKGEGGSHRHRQSAFLLLQPHPYGSAGCGGAGTAQQIAQCDAEQPRMQEGVRTDGGLSGGKQQQRLPQSGRQPLGGGE